MDMGPIESLKDWKSLKRFAVDSLAHTIFYGAVGLVIAMALGVDPELFMAMSIAGTAAQFLCGGIFGRFLDLVRRMAGV
jgi:hypothetical protein